MKIAIVGMGFVGHQMLKLFPDAIQIDPPKDLGDYQQTYDCELSIVCVPTPMLEDGSCDTSIVESAVEQIESKLILIRSTVEPGTCGYLVSSTGKRIIFSPEYLGESSYYTPPQYPQPDNEKQHGFMILGGRTEDCSAVADIFLPVIGPCTRFRFMNSREAELVKYAENSFFALKVTFSNLLRRICEATGCNYHTVREGWLDDPRVGPMHSAAFKNNRGFGGKCLPKDLRALKKFCKHYDVSTELLDAVLEQNRTFNSN